MIIKKFKNGKLKLEYEKGDISGIGSIFENVYYDDMFMNDLYINQINGYQYLIDFNKSIVYDLRDYTHNPLYTLLNDIQKFKKVYYYPLNKKECKSLLQDLENGY